ncbi:hypothetical protein L1887_55129 [Cichorium endivia]|nr:hypothetical protein L1887_55129 [Cichorium endivia]
MSELLNRLGKQLVVSPKVRLIVYEYDPYKMQKKRSPIDEFHLSSAARQLRQRKPGKLSEKHLEKAEKLERGLLLPPKTTEGLVGLLRGLEEFARFVQRGPIDTSETTAVQSIRHTIRSALIFEYVLSDASMSWTSDHREAVVFLNDRPYFIRAVLDLQKSSENLQNFQRFFLDFPGFGPGLTSEKVQENLRKTDFSGFEPDVRLQKKTSKSRAWRLIVIYKRVQSINPNFAIADVRIELWHSTELQRVPFSMLLSDQNKRKIT